MYYCINVLLIVLNFIIYYCINYFLFLLIIYCTIAFVLMIWFELMFMYDRRDIVSNECFKYICKILV